MAGEGKLTKDSHVLNVPSYRPYVLPTGTVCSPELLELDWAAPATQKWHLQDRHRRSSC